ncbi:MAG: hypothetical protein CEN89_613 [Candidatus Berkelbacteria bacterium Licking1014_7]|uniref:Uncharacterized protein n=1 Tax=Candidatus Berkelbacteria bacterium Licking1014_7 TaxID=2017147 RepID=A0A554LI95_9BACT|nr:MAG: hypothetical protein CEN89_613 [Candidatus Berkelbacteria bacterium Licking1014_7]
MNNEQRKMPDEEIWEAKPTGDETVGNPDFQTENSILGGKSAEKMARGKRAEQQNEPKN